MFDKTAETNLIVERINFLLNRSGKSLRQFAIDAGVYPSTFSRYVNKERSPDLLAMLAICKEYGYSMDWLCGLSDVIERDDQRAEKLWSAYSQAPAADRKVVELVLSKYGYNK